MAGEQGFATQLCAMYCRFPDLTKKKKNPQRIGSVCVGVFLSLDAFCQSAGGERWVSSERAVKAVWVSYKALQVHFGLDDVVNYVP